jgi:hypothetical protein
MYLLIDLPKTILTHLLHWVKIVLGMYVISNICNSKATNVINDHEHVCDDCLLGTGGGWGGGGGGGVFKF